MGLGRQDIVKTFGRSEADTGSPEVQIALLTNRIRNLTEQHFKTNKQDKHSRKGLLSLVSLRKRLLKYLKSLDISRYRILIQKLELRDSH